MRSELPEPIRDHFVVIGGRRFPPKQVLGAVTGLDRADFTTHQARSLLRRLGFLTGRARGGPAGTATPTAEHPQGLAEALRPFRGQWVAIAGDEVLVGAGSPREVLSWLERHNRPADSLFRVPIDPTKDQAAAPA